MATPNRSNLPGYDQADPVNLLSDQDKQASRATMAQRNQMGPEERKDFETKARHAIAEENTKARMDDEVLAMVDDVHKEITGTKAESSSKANDEGGASKKSSGGGEKKDG